MGQTFFMVKVVFEYFIQYFKSGESEPYTSYAEKYFCIKVFDENAQYNKIIDDCRQEIESDFTLNDKDNDDEGNEFECEITYDFGKLVSYEIIAAEDSGALS